MGVYTCGLSVGGECLFLAVFCMDILFEDWERWGSQIFPCFLVILVINKIVGQSLSIYTNITRENLKKSCNKLFSSKEVNLRSK